MFLIWLHEPQRFYVSIFGISKPVNGSAQLKPMRKLTITWQGYAAESITSCYAASNKTLLSLSIPPPHNRDRHAGTETMKPRSIDFSLPLFVPADRPERYAKAMAAGADCVIIDLEDAVAPANKAQARNILFDALSSMDGSAAIVVRINAHGSVWHGDDIAALRPCKIAGVMVPKPSPQAFCCR